MLDKFCTIYIDKILMYGNSKKKYQTYIQKVLVAFQKAGLQVNINKCKFYITKISYLGLIISTKGIYINFKKVEAIQNWETLTCVRDVQAFIRFANFYHHFIRAFFNVVHFMIAIVKKNTTFYQTLKYWKFFELFIKRFTTTPILAHFDFKKKTFLRPIHQITFLYETFSNMEKKNCFTLWHFFPANTCLKR